MALTSFESSHAGINLNIGNATTPVFTSDFDGFASDTFTLQFSLTDAEASSGDSTGYTPYTSYLETEGFDFSGFTFGFNNDANQFEFHTTDNETLTFDASSLSMNDGAPHHFALSFDKELGQINLNVDGASIGSQSLPNALSLFGGGDLVFGQSLSDFTSGSFDNPALGAPAGAAVLQDISVFNEIRSDEQIALDAKFGEATPVTSPTLSHQWDMTSANAGALADAVSGTIATINPTAVVSGSVAATLPDAGVEINTQSATNSEMVMVENFTGFAGTPFTMQVDFASTTQLADESFIGLVSYAEPDYDNSLLIGMRDGESFQVFAEDIGFVQFDYDLNSLMDGGQHTLSVVADPDEHTFTLYVDGRSLGTKEFNGELSIEGGGTLVFGQEQDRVGGGFDADQAFEGVITEARVFNELRSEEEIVADAIENDTPIEGDALTSAWNFEAEEQGAVLDLVGDSHGMALTEELGTTLAAPELPDYGRGLTLNSGDDVGQSAAVADFDGFTSDSFTFEMSFASVMNIGDEYNALVSYAETNYDNAFTVGTNHGGNVLQVHARSIGLINFETDAWGLMDGEEHSLALSVNNDTLEMSIYIDGELVGTETMSEALTVQGGGTLVFGQEQDFVGGGFDPDQEFQGTYFDAALFQDVRTAEEIASDHENGLNGSEDALYANWEFGADGVVDAVGNHNATVDLQGDTTVNVDGLAGGIPLNLESTDQRLEVQDFTGFEGEQTTVEVGFSSTMDLSGGFKPLLSYSEPGFDNALTIGFAHNGTGIQIHMKGQSPITFGVDAIELMDGNQHEIAITMDEATGEMGLFIDGDFIGRQDMNPIGLEGNGILVFGQEQDSFGGGFSDDQIFEGMMHEVRVFDEVRSAEEILSDASGNVDSVSEPNLVAHWDMQLDRDLTVDDLVGNQSLQAINISLADEAIPEFGETEFADLTEGAGEGTVVATVSASDQNWDAVSFQLNDDHDGMFVINAQTGEVTVAEGHSLDADAQENYAIEVEALENGVSVGAVQTLEINVGDVQETINVGADAYVDHGDAGDTLVGAAADDNVITGDTGNNVIIGDSGAASFDDGGNDVLSGGDGSDEIYGQGGNDVISGGFGNDYIEGNRGDDFIYGGEGSDTARFYGNLEDFTIEYDEDSNAFTITDLNAFDGNEGVDIVSGVETFLFDNNGAVTTLSSDDMIVRANLGNNAGTIAANDGVTLHTDSNGAYVIETSDGDYLNVQNRGVDVTTDTYSTWDAVGVSTTSGGDFQVIWQNSDNSQYSIWTTDENGGYTTHRTVNASDDEAVRALENQFGIDLNGDNVTSNILATTEDDNRIVGAGGDDEIVGDEGRDVLYGRDGDDTISGGSGNDHIEGGEGADIIDGGTGNDYIRGGEGGDIIDGGEGRDTIDYSRSHEGVEIDLSDGTANGGDAEGDVITNVENVYGSNLDDILSGDGARNTLHGRDGDDELNGGDDRDHLYGGNGDDIISGGDGNDYIRGMAGADEIDGGAGTDKIDYYESDAGVTIDLGEQTVSGGHAEGDTITSIEQALGSNHDDVLIGSDDKDYLHGRDGNDEIDGGDGNDNLIGAKGDDVLSGGEGNDSLNGGQGVDTLDAGVGNDRIYGGDGDDIITGGDGNDYIRGQGGSDTIDGGDGIDKIDYYDSDEGVNINLADQTVSGGDAEGDTITSIEQALGSNHDDQLTGSENNDYLHGRDGDDVINTDSGNDRAYGGNGNDVVTGGEGNDRLFGQGGDDVLIGDILPEDELENLMVNGSFEDTSNGTGAHVTPPGWDVLGQGFGVYRYGGDRGTDGSYSMPLGGWSGQNTAGISQTIETVVGQTYTLSFDAGAKYGGSNATLSVDVIGDGNSILSELIAETDEEKGMDAYRFTFVATSETSTIAFTLPETEANKGIDFDIDRVGVYEGDVVPQISGNDHLYGGDGDDVIFGGGGNDYIRGQGGADVIDGGAGTDKIDYYDSDAGVNINLADQTVSGGDAEGDTITSIEQALGSNHDDVLTGSDQADYLHGREGDDTINGGDGNDNLIGHIGDDVLIGEDGNDSLNGGQGNDILNAGLGNDRLYGGDGDDVIFGGAGNDYIRGMGGADEIDGGTGRDRIDYYESDAGVNINLADQTVSGGHAEGDTIANIEDATGSKLDDVIIGSDGDNSLSGRDGDDVIFGGAGNDGIYGGLGDDTLNGGSGRNTLIGNQGSDVFEISGSADETGTRLFGGNSNGTQNDASWTDTVSMDIQNVAGLLYGAGDVERNDGYLELTNGDMTISIEAAGSALDFNYDELTGIASVSLETNTDALLKVDVDNDGTFDTTYNLYDIESISLS